MDPINLRPTLLEILAFLQAYIGKNGFAPSYDEIMEGTSVASKSVVSYNLKDLEQKGIIRRMPNVPRSIRILIPLQGESDGHWPVRRSRTIPLLGRISAGAPIEVPNPENREFDGSEGIDIDEALLPRKYAGRDLFALKVRGDSMIDAGVLDGDLIIVEAVSQVDNGDMAVVWFPEQGETTLKYFHRKGDRVVLKPANTALQAKDYDARMIQVQGRLVMRMHIY